MLKFQSFDPDAALECVDRAGKLGDVNLAAGYHDRGSVEADERLTPKHGSGRRLECDHLRSVLVRPGDDERRVWVDGQVQAVAHGS